MALSPALPYMQNLCSHQGVVEDLDAASLGDTVDGHVATSHVEGRGAGWLCKEGSRVDTGCDSFKRSWPTALIHRFQTSAGPCNAWGAGGRGRQGGAAIRCRGAVAFHRPEERCNGACDPCPKQSAVPGINTGKGFWGEENAMLFQEEQMHLLQAHPEGQTLKCCHSRPHPHITPTHFSHLRPHSRMDRCSLNRLFSSAL